MPAVSVTILPSDVLAAVTVGPELDDEAAGLALDELLPPPLPQPATISAIAAPEASVAANLRVISGSSLKASFLIRKTPAAGRTFHAAAGEDLPLGLR